MITLEIESGAVYNTAQIYADTGSGFEEADSIKLPYQSTKVAKRLIRFANRPIGVRFDPMTNSGEFSINQFNFTPVTFGFAENRMLRKLASVKPLTYGDTSEGAKQIVVSQARQRMNPYKAELEASYAQLFSLDQAHHSYRDWIEYVEKYSFPSPTDIETLERREDRPLVSLIMPTYNSDVIHLNAAIESVVSQHYTHWQLCISDDGSTDSAAVEAIKSWVERDARITAVFNAKSTGIAQNTNSALALAEGKFCAFLDHDDMLAPHALYEVVRSAIENPAAKLIYSDEDKVSSDGTRVAPHFKPDWNPDLLLSQNYICHLVAVCRKELESINGIRQGFDGAQDHDLLLRLSAQIDSSEIVHIDKILYHWRMTARSTAYDAGAKTYTSDSGVAAIEDFLATSGATANVEKGKFDNTYRVKWGVTEVAPKVSIIIPTRDMLDILSQCIDSIFERTDYENYEIVVVNNDSKNRETLDYFENITQKDNVSILDYSGAFNYSAINNYAVDRVDGEVIVMMNNDVEVIDSDWLTELVGHVMRPEVGCVGAKLLYRNNMIQHAGVILGIGGVAGHAHKYFDSESSGYFSRLHLTQNMSAVTAACLAVRRETYIRVGGFNESELKVAFNDVDFCLRVQELGLRNVWSPYAVLYHHESISRGHENTPEKQKRFNSEMNYMKNTWGDVLSHDPAYNRNLTLVKEDFSLAA